MSEKIPCLLMLVFVLNIKSKVDECGIKLKVS